jgi:hypothetical protein
MKFARPDVDRRQRRVAGEEGPVLYGLVDLLDVARLGVVREEVDRLVVALDELREREVGAETGRAGGRMPFVKS